MKQAIRLVLLLVLPLLFGTGQRPSPPADAAGLLREAQVLLDSARYEDALVRGQAALQLSVPGEQEAGDCLLVLGDVFLEMGQWEAAYQQYTEALSIFQQKRGAGDLSTAQAINQIGEYFYKKNDYVQAENAYRQALQIREKDVGVWHELVADSYNNLGNCRASRGEYAAAAALHEKALAIRQRTLPATHPDLATSFNNLGNCAYYVGDYGLALAYFEKALIIRETVFGAGHPKTAQVLNNLGNACVAVGQQQRAIDYYHQALDIRLRHFGDRHPSVASTQENIADLYFDTGEYIAALDFFRQAYAIQRDLHGEHSAAAASLWQKIGLCYQYEGDLERALAHYLAAEPALVATFGPRHPAIGGLYNNMGNCFSGKKDFAHALGYYARALSIFHSVQPRPRATIALIYNNLGTISLDKNQPREALRYFTAAWTELEADKAKNASESAIYLKNQGVALEKLGRWPDAREKFEQAMQIARTTDPIADIGLLNDWATLLCQRGTRAGDTSLLRMSVEVFEKARQRSDSLQNLLSSAGSRQRWLELQFPSQASAIEAYYQLWTRTGDSSLAERAFSLAERSKSLQVLEQLRKEQAERFAGIPDSLLRTERDRREQLNLREKELLAAQRAGNPAGITAAEAGVAEARQAVLALIREFEQHYPDYFRLKYDRHTATLATIRQQVLAPDQALLEYFEGDSVLFAFVITRMDFRFLRLAPGFALPEAVSGLRRVLQAYPEAGEQAAARLSADYAEQAYRIQAAVFAPVARSVALPAKLLVVPDGALAYLPFECLLGEAPANARQFKSHRYLLRDHCFSYAYSATQQLALLQLPPRMLPKNLLAVAPAYAPQRYGLQPLQNNVREVTEAGALFGGDVQAGEQATVPAFLHAAGQYRILLLSMHGKASSTVGDLSYLAFSTTDTTQNPFLYTRDLYSQSIPAELVVLSACETSVGEYRFGQGVISLAKGFFQAGARSVAATLWSVDDARNTELMHLFFQQIKAGVGKDEALQRAKLAFLQNHPHAEAHPAYWAAVTAYGDMRPVALRQTDYKMIMGFVVLLALLFGWVMRRRT